MKKIDNGVSRLCCDNYNNGGSLGVLWKYKEWTLNSDMKSDRRLSMREVISKLSLEQQIIKDGVARLEVSISGQPGREAY